MRAAAKSEKATVGGGAAVEVKEVDASSSALQPARSPSMPRLLGRSTSSGPPAFRRRRARTKLSGVCGGDACTCHRSAGGVAEQNSAHAFFQAPLPLSSFLSLFYRLARSDAAKPAANAATKPAGGLVLRCAGGPGGAIPARFIGARARDTQQRANRRSERRLERRGGLNPLFSQPTSPPRPQSRTHRLSCRRVLT